MNLTVRVNVLKCFSLGHSRLNFVMIISLYFLLTCLPSFVSSNSIRLANVDGVTTANFGNHPKKDKITLKDLLHNEFAVAHFNGTWLTDNQLIYRDINANILTLNVSSSPTASCSAKSSAKDAPQVNEPSILLHPHILADYYNFVSKLVHL